MPDNNLPETENLPADDSAQDAQKLDRRTAIAQARAIRREAAAMEEEIKAQATETAASIIENAEPAPPKAPLHNKTEPVPVSNATGKFGWLDELKKPEPQPPQDTDALVEQLLAETDSKPRPSDSGKNDAVIAKIVAEKTVSPEVPETVVEKVLVDTAPEPDESDSAGETKYAADEPYARAEEPEEQIFREIRRMTGKASAMSASEAAAQYRTLTADAAPKIRKRAKQFDRVWNKEAGMRHAAETQNRFAPRAAKWNIALCLVMLFGIAAGMLIFERPTVSMEENRTLAKMPEFSVESYLSGKYTSGVAEYYNDTVPFRSTFKKWTQNIRKCMGLSSSAVIIGNVPAAQQPTESAPAETTLPAAVTTAVHQTTDAVLTTVSVTETTAAAEPDEPEREGELSQNILIVDKRGIMLFGGWESLGEPYANVLNRFKESAPEINMYNMTIPTVCSFYTPEEFQHLITSEKVNIDYINNHLVGVEPVDAYGALEKHKDETIFMRTDHHWSSLGAFYAAEEFSATARVPFARIEEYDRYSKDDYVGTLYGFSGNIILKENPEEFFWYVPKTDFRTTFYSNSYTNPYEANFFMNLDNTAPVSYYMVYMSGDDHIVHLETSMHNGRKLCVIKDSYGNALIPWLTSSFEEIYVIDTRYFKLNAISFLREHGVTDVLFAMNSFSANGDNGLKIDTLRTQ